MVDGEAGIGKTTLLRAWAARRAAAGDTVLLASCGRLDRAMPLDALLRAFAALLRRLGPEETADLLGTDAVLLGPLLGVTPGPRPLLELTDGLLGPAVLYAALLRVLGRLAGRGPVVVVIDDAHLAGPALPDWVRFAQRGEVPLALVLAIRPGAGEPLPGHRVRPPRRARPPGRGRAGGAGPDRRAVPALPGPPAVPHRARPAGGGRGAARLPGRVGVRAV